MLRPKIYNQEATACLPIFLTGALPTVQDRAFCYQSSRFRALCRVTVGGSEQMSEKRTTGRWAHVQKTQCPSGSTPESKELSAPSCQLVEVGMQSRVQMLGIQGRAVIFFLSLQ